MRELGREEKTECGILNQLKVTENDQEPSTTLSIVEETHMEQTPNVPSNREQCSLTWQPRAGSTTRHVGVTCTILFF